MTHRENTIARSIEEKLGINSAQLASLFTLCPVEGYDGRRVSDELTERFGEDLERAELTDEELDYIHDA